MLEFSRRDKEMVKRELRFYEASFLTAETGWVTPGWKHVGCGGRIYAIHGSQDFACNRCLAVGQLVAGIPDTLPMVSDAAYILRELRELDIVPHQQS